jgi:poly(3-hydroxybutyrate) depolymerase
MRSFAAELIALVFCSGAIAAERLPGHAADNASFTVSGLSSGGYMAVQMHVAHSSRIKGVGALAAGPYYCAQGSLWTATQSCMRPAGWNRLPDINALKAQAERFAGEGAIDSTSNLASARAWIFHGTRDQTVGHEVAEALGSFYALFNTKFVFVKDKPAGHAIVTENAGNACGTSEPPFIEDCNFDAAGQLLGHLLGNLSPAAEKPSGRLLAFDQREFGDAYAISMADAGYAYLPRACDSERCRVHVAFHGCRQGAETVGERFVRDAGYNRWADTNRLIVLYPQAIARYFWVYNPRGCWDWWGYTGKQYATRQAAQIRAVLAMVDRLGAPRK